MWQAMKFRDPKPQTHSSASAQRAALHTLRQMLGYKIPRVKPNKVPQSSLWINRSVSAGVENRYYTCTASFVERIAHIKIQ